MLGKFIVTVIVAWELLVLIWKLWVTTGDLQQQVTLKEGQAYVFYAMELPYLCAALLNAKRLRAFGTNATIAVMVNEDWNLKSICKQWRSRSSGRSQHHNSLDPTSHTIPNSWSAHPGEVFQGVSERGFDLDAILSAFRNLQVELLPVPSLKRQAAPGHDDDTWGLSLTKLRVFQQTRFARVVYLDADGLVLQNMDHLFRLQINDVALPRAHWLNRTNYYSDHVMVLQPSEENFQRLAAEAASGGFDMDVVNRVLGGACTVLPYNYGLLSGEFRKANHAGYLRNGPSDRWNATAELQAAPYIHFSEWPDLPKPWEAADANAVELATPRCPPQCEERRAWLWLHWTYQREARAMCMHDPT